jgi:transglutaminase-like putative cysteine protease
MKKEKDFFDNVREDVEDFVEDAEEDLESAWKKFKKSGIKYIFAAFLVFIFIFSMFAYFINIEPSPSNIPFLEEVVPENLEYERINATKYTDYIIVDSEIKTIADKIASQSCGSGETVCHAKAMFFFVKENFDYVSDPSRFEYVKTAKESLVNQGGDCDDASVLLSTLL